MSAAQRLPPIGEKFAAHLLEKVQRARRHATSVQLHMVIEGANYNEPLARLFDELEMIERAIEGTE
jgi:hypothetical protein